MSLQPSPEQMTLGYWLRWFTFLAIMAVLGSIISKRIFKINA